MSLIRKIKISKVWLGLVLITVLVIGMFLFFQFNRNSVQAAQTVYPPTGVHKTSITTNSINWAWSAPTLGSTPDYYQIRNEEDVLIKEESSTSWTQGSLNANTQYSIRIRSCVYAGGCSDFSNPASAYTAAKIPVFLSDPYRDATSYSLTWDWFANGNPDGTQYVARDGNGDETNGNSGWISGTSWMENYQINECYDYTHILYVKAKNGDGVETSEAPKEFKLNSCPEDGLINFTAVTGSVSGAVTLGWTVKYASFGREYEYIEVTRDGGENWTTVVAGSNNYTGLTPGQTYSLQLRGRNTDPAHLAQENNWATTLPLGPVSATAGGTAPTVPITPTLSHENVFADSITWTWGAIGGATYYELLVDSVSGYHGSFFNLTALEQLNGALNPSTPYDGRLRACNATGCSAYASDSATTLALTCGNNDLSNEAEWDYDSGLCPSGKWSLTAGEFTSICWPDMCCGDDASEYRTTDFGESTPPAKVNWANTGAVACCSTSGCVRGTICYDYGYQDFGSGQDKKVLCNPSPYYPGWNDLDVGCNLGLCSVSTNCTNAGFEWVTAGETGVGEYAENGAPIQCCGDDDGESYKCNGGTCKCCDSSSDTIDGSGNCAGASAPDLIVENVSAPALMCVGDSASFSAVIKNQGNAGTGAGFSSSITLTGAIPCTDSSPALAANGGTDTISCSIKPNSVGTKTIYSDADYDDAISESNEDNNSESTSGTVLATASTPTGLAATNIGATAITWQWNAVVGASGYYLKVNDGALNYTADNNYTASPLSGALDYIINVYAHNSCGSSSPAQNTVTRGVSLAGSPASQTVNQGVSAIYTIAVSSVNGLADTVNLTLSGCPTGATCELSSNSVTLNNNSQDVTLTVSGAGVGGPYTLTIAGLGASSGKSGSTTVGLTVVDSSAPSVSIWAIPQAIESGESSAVSWLSANANSVDITNIGTDVGTSGTQTVSPTVSTTYTATAYGSGGQTATASVTVTVVSGGTYCGDGICNGVETCSDCPSDCGVCPVGGGSEPNTPESLSGPTGCTTDDTPSFSFTISDPDAGDTVGYQIQIDNSATFDSPTIDFTWGGSTDNPKDANFDTPSSCPSPLGGYAACEAPLPAGNYYWRVRALDDDSNFSDYAAGATFSVAGACDSGSGEADFEVCKYNDDTLQFTNLTTGISSPVYGWNFDDGTGCAETGCTATIGGETIGTRIDPAHEFEENFWARRVKITFNNGGQAENLTDFPVMIKLNSSRVDYSQIQDDGDDLRFFDADGGTELPYEIEKWNEAGNSYVWVKVPQIDASSASDYIWLYYGNPAASAGENIEDVWNSGYAAVYHLKETSGKHYDSTDNNNDSKHETVTTQGSAIGKMDGADEFDGTPSFHGGIDIDDGNSLDIADAITLEAWVKPTSLNSRGRIFTKISELYVLRQDIFPEGSLFGYFIGGGRAKAENVLSTSELKHVALTWDRLNGDHNVRLYVNGVEPAYSTQPESTQTSRTSALGTSNSYLQLGGDIDQSWGGIMDEMRISDVARSAAWMKAQYLSMSDTFASYESAETLGWLISGSRVAGANNEARIKNQELRTTSDNQQSIINNQQKTNSNIFEKVWQGIKKAGEWVMDLFKAEDSEALSTKYSVMLSAFGSDGNDTETKVITLADVPFCEFDLTGVSSASCGRVDGEWEKFGGFNDSNNYLVKRCLGNLAECDTEGDFFTASVTKSCGTTCYFEDVTVEPSTTYSYYISLPSQSVKNSTLDPACDGTTAICPLAVTTAVCGVEDSGIRTLRSCGKITLIWEEVEGSALYEVQRAVGSDSPDKFVTVFTAGEGTISYEDRDVITVTTTKPATQFRYWYRVRSQASNGQWSEWSNASPTAGEYSYCYRGPNVEER